jgi:hypothetical protein
MVADWQGALRFKVPFLPKQDLDRCYLVWRGHVVGWMAVTGSYEGDFTCETTGTQWSGKFIERSGPFHHLATPAPMRGFQGFRYIDRESIS